MGAIIKKYPKLYFISFIYLSLLYFFWEFYLKKKPFVSYGAIKKYSIFENISLADSTVS